MHFSVFYFLDHYINGKQPEKSQEEIYDEAISQAVFADQLGYDGLFVAEHHFHHYGLVPNPYIILTAIARETKLLKLGSAVSILPFHNPIHIVEDLYMLDILSKGRAILGVGSGFLESEFKGFSVDINKKRELFDLALMKVKLLINSKEDISVNNGSSDWTELSIKPYNNRKISMFVGSVTTEAAYHIGMRGENLLSFPFNSLNAPENCVGLTINQYRKGLQDGGHKSNEKLAVMNFFCHVAESDEKAIENIKLPFGKYVCARRENTYNENTASQIFNDYYTKSFILCGSPATVRERLMSYIDLGVNHFMLFHNFGLLNPKLVSKSLELFAEKVIPRIV